MNALSPNEIDLAHIVLVGPAFHCTDCAPFLVLLGAGEGFALLTGSEYDSPWNDTDKLRAEVTSNFCAAVISPPFAAPPPPLESAELGRGVAGRRLSADCDRLAAAAAVLEIRGDGHLLEEEQDDAEEDVDEADEEDVVVVEEAEDDDK